MPFLQYLVDQGIITKYHFDEIIAAMNKGEAFDAAAKRLEIDQNRLRTARSGFFGFPESDFDEAKVTKEVLAKIPEAAARNYHILPLSVSPEGVLRIGMVDPENSESLNALQFLFSDNTQHDVAVITQGDFERGLATYAKLSMSDNSADPNVAMEGDAAVSSQEEGLDLGGNGNVLDLQAEDPNADKKETIVVDAPAVKSFNVIIQNALDGGASDIHIEPTDAELRVRYRLDGDLFTSLTLPKQMAAAIVARVKILTKTMKLDEKRKPQDGRFYAMIGGRKIDFRVSTMPTFFGEKVVIRILDPSKGGKGIDSLGLLPDHLALVNNAITLPYGMVLVTGPTGSGKSTTLYSMISGVDKEKKNVVSLEDPVEYNMPGMSQSQVQAEIGYTFASGLRSILRQDPDVIMVGEIRDKETAQLAIQAALTGHLVFSTLHTNTAIGAIARLVDMGVDPYLIPPVLKLIISQRLVHKLNPSIPGVAVPIEGSIAEIVEHEFADLPDTYKAQLPIGSAFYDADESKSGSKSGRIAVFEMVEMNRELESLILKDSSEPGIYKWARDRGFRTVKEDAMIKSSQGIVPWSEVHEL